MRAIGPILLCVALLSASGCMLVDYAVDPVGCGTGTHEPIFPWYPSYLWNPPKPRKPGLAVNPNQPLPGPPGRLSSQAIYSGVEPPSSVRTDPITGERLGF